MRRNLSLLAMALALAAGSAVANDSLPREAPEPMHYRMLWENSPFLRPLNAAESYVLTSVVRIDGKPVVTMLNTTTGERFPLSSEANAAGWRLIELHNDTDPRNVMATVSINGEEVAVRFNEAQLSSSALEKATVGPGLPSPPPGARGQHGGANRPNTSRLNQNAGGGSKRERAKKNRKKERNSRKPPRNQK